MAAPAIIASLIGLAMAAGGTGPLGVDLNGHPVQQLHDLEEAIRAVLANQPVSQPGGPPVGCSIVTSHP